MHRPLPGVVQVTARAITLGALAVVLAACIPLAGKSGGGAGGSAGPGAAATRASILLPETFLAGDRLYTSFAADTEAATARLVQGDRVLGTLAPRQECHAVVDPRLVRGDDPPYRDECSFAVPGLAAGRYAIEVASGSTVLARADFDVIAVPAAGEHTALAVDPAVRVGVPYLTGDFSGDRLWIWYPIDARYAWRSIYLHGFAGDTHRGMTGGTLGGPRIRRAGDPAIHVDLAYFEMRELDAAETVVVTAGRTVLGAWRPPADGKTWTPVAVSDAIAAAAVAKIEERFQATTTSYGFRHRVPMLGRRMVARVCAAITSASTMALIETIQAEGAATKATAATSVTTVGSMTFESDAGSIISGSRRWDTDTTSHGVMLDETPHYRGLIKKLDGKSRAFTKRGDCFDRVFAAYPWVLPEPDADEPDALQSCGPEDGCPERSRKRDPHMK